MQCVEYQIQKNYNHWRKLAIKYTGSKINGEYLLSDVLTGVLERPEINAKTCEEGFLGHYVNHILWLRRNESKKKMFDELPANLAQDDDPVTPPIDVEIMQSAIELVVQQLPPLDRELFRAYKMGMKPSELAELLDVDPDFVANGLRKLKLKIKRRIKVYDNE